MNRRGFLQGMLAAGAAPAIVKASSLMPIFVPKLWTPAVLQFGPGIVSAEEILAAQREFNEMLSRWIDQAALSPKAPWLSGPWAAV